MTVYHLVGPTWSRAFRCIWMMEELGIQYTLHESMPSSAAVKKHNPSGKVPVLLEYEDQQSSLLEDSRPSFVLAESAAINTYLGESFGSNIIPGSAREKALYDQTILFILSEIDGQALWTYRKHAELGKYFGHLPEIEEPCKAHFEKMNKLMSDQLEDSGGPYLLGKDFTAADILYVHCLGWAKSYDWHHSYSERLLDYVTLCLQRPGYQKAKAIRDDTTKRTSVQDINAKI
mmetsp:Transcript_6942/g.9015  ORF Transcript_6942/g.9015 Transcript_6942/m.9015 type:complete len:232 (+) Transcript_6942:84-779(+)